MLIYTSLIIILEAKVSINFLRPHSASLLLLSIYNRAAHSKISDNIVTGSSRKYRKILYIVWDTILRGCRMGGAQTA